MSGIRVAVLVCTTFFVVASTILLVACRRSGTFSTGVVTAGAACPAVVVWGAAGGLDTCGAELLSEVGPGHTSARLDRLHTSGDLTRSMVLATTKKGGTNKNCNPDP